MHDTGDQLAVVIRWVGRDFLTVEEELHRSIVSAGQRHMVPGIRNGFGTAQGVRAIGHAQTALIINEGLPSDHVEVHRRVRISIDTQDALLVVSRPEPEFHGGVPRSVRRPIGTGELDHGIAVEVVREVHGMSAIRAVPPGIHDDVTAPCPVHRCAAEFIEGQPSLEADFLSCYDEFRGLRGIGLPLAVPETEVLQRQLQCISRSLSTRPAIAQGDSGALNAQFGQEAYACQSAVQVDLPIVTVQGGIRDEHQFNRVPQAVPLGVAVGQAYRFLRVRAIGSFGRQSELI